MDKGNREMNEEVCEILRECNATDIELLYLLKNLSENKKREYFLWEEFIQQMGLPDTLSASDIINKAEYLEVEVGKTRCPYLVRALSKMQRLGVVEMEQLTTAGSVNSNRIKGIQLTVFGMKLMEHLKPLD